VKFALFVVPSKFKNSEATASVEVTVTIGNVFDDWTGGNNTIETVAGNESAKPSLATNVNASVTVVRKFVVEM